MKFTQLFRNLLLPHLWLTRAIFGIDDAALFAGGGALLGGLFGGSEDEQDPQLTGINALPPWLQQSLIQGNTGAQDLYNQGPLEQYPGQTYADLDPNQLAGLQQNLDFAGGLQPTIDNIFGSFNQGINPDTVNDPAVQASLASMENRANTNFFENIVPGLRRGGTGAGQGFGTRPELAAGVAGSKLNQDILNAQGTFLGNQLNSARALQGGLLGNAGSILGTGMVPGQIQQDVGQQFQNQDQLAILDLINKFNFEQNAPGQNLDDFLARSQGIAGAGGGASITPGQNTGVSTISAALAGGLLGSQAGDVFSSLINQPKTGGLTSYQPNFGGGQF